LTSCEPELPTPDKTVDWIAKFADPCETATFQNPGRRALLCKRVGNDGAYAGNARASKQLVDDGRRDTPSLPGGGNGIAEFDGAIYRFTFPPSVADQGPIRIKEKVRSPIVRSSPPRRFQDESQSFREAGPVVLDWDAKPLGEHGAALR
jgi:hypothetical protein